MIVERKEKTVFQPVTITIESEQEYHTLLAALNISGNSIVKQAQSISEIRGTFVYDGHLLGKMYREIKSIIYGDK